MFNWKKWQLFVLLGFFALILLLFAITYGIKIKFDLNSADTLAFAQLVLSTLLLPTVIVGFSITVQSFRETQELPDLDLFLEQKTGLYEKSLKFNSSEIFKRRKEWRVIELFTGSINPPSIDTEIPFSLVIQNKGNVIALWYAISINIQLDVAPTAYLNWTQFYKTTGEHWQINHTELDKSMRFEAMFMSNGTLASYPNLPIKVCEMNTGWFLVEKSPSREYQISYTIVTDRGLKKQGLLKLVFQPETT